LALATAAALLASRWMLDRAQVAQSQRPTTQGLMIASRDLAAGTRLETEDVKAMQVVATDRPMGSFISKDEVVGQIVTTELRAGELVLAPHLSVRVDDVVGVAGFILPGNHVDVIATREEGRQTYAQTLLSNVRVLAVDQQASADPTTPQVVRAVTLEVTPQGAEAIARARHQGQLQLSLRHPRDGGEAGPTLHMAEVAAPSAASPAAATTAPAATPARPRQSTPSDRVEVLRGTHRSRSGG
jgi:pilus assembly protein CpaB